MFAQPHVYAHDICPQTVTRQRNFGKHSIGSSNNGRLVFAVIGTAPNRGAHRVVWTALEYLMSVCHVDQH
jgi:hypothetical protein